MSGKVFRGRKPVLFNILMIGLLIITVVVYWFISQSNPHFTFIIIFLFLDFRVLGFFLLTNNTLTYTISNDLLMIKWLTGKHEFRLNTIIGYYNYIDPRFEVHFEASYIGAKLKRNTEGEFYYFSLGIRKGLTIDYTSDLHIEKFFIVPKHSEKFIDELRLLLMQNFNKKIAQFHGKFHVKQSECYSNLENVKQLKIGVNSG